MNVAGTYIGKYEVVDVIGIGGMGVVYKAIDHGIGRPVAIKMITRGLHQNPELVRRFHREVQAAGTLLHPNVVIIYELGEVDNTPYMVMEYLDGESLAEVIAVHHRDVPIVQKLELLHQSCDALHYAHLHGVIHRDVKPANIMVLKDGGIKLVDFGIARIANDTFTRSGQVIGTVAYMSPEQLNGLAIDARTDIFSLSMVAFELLTGVHPFGGKDTASTVRRIINEPPTPIGSLLSDYPNELEQILARGLSKDREERYASANDMGFDLACLQEKLKRGLITQYLQRVRTLMGEGKHDRAKELLKDVISIDSQNEMARELMVEVQLALQKEHRIQQAQTLRKQAEEVAARKDYSEALVCIEQALVFDNANAELLGMRVQLQEVRAKAEQERQEAVTQAVLSARSAMRVGDLDKALQIIQSFRKTQGESTEVRRVLRDIERQRQHVAQAAVERAVRDAEALLLGKQWRPAFCALDRVAQLVKFVPEEVKARYVEMQSRWAACMAQGADAKGEKTEVAGPEVAPLPGCEAPREIPPAVAKEEAIQQRTMPYSGNLALEPRLDMNPPAGLPATERHPRLQLVPPPIAVAVADPRPAPRQAEPPSSPSSIWRRVLILVAIGLLLVLSYATYSGYRITLMKHSLMHLIDPHLGFWNERHEIASFADGRCDPAAPFTTLMRL